MPGSQQVGRRVRQDLNLVVEHLQRQPGVQFRVVDTPTPQPSILIMLNQMVIGVTRKRQRIEHKRVHHGEPQQPQTRVRRFQVRQIEADQIMPQEKICAISKALQPGQSPTQTNAPHREIKGFTEIRTHPSKSPDTAVSPSRLQGLLKGNGTKRTRRR